MGRGKHKPFSYREKRQAYKARRLQPGYPKGGFNKARGPYAKPKRG